MKMVVFTEASFSLDHADGQATLCELNPLAAAFYPMVYPLLAELTAVAALTRSQRPAEADLADFARLPPGAALSAV